MARTTNDWLKIIYVAITDIMIPGGVGGLPTVLYSGTVLVSSVAMALPTITLRRGVTLRLGVDALDMVFVGHDGVLAGAGYPLQPGDTLHLDIADLGQVWAIAPTAAYSSVPLYWVAS